MEPKEADVAVWAKINVLLRIDDWWAAGPHEVMAEFGWRSTKKNWLDRIRTSQFQQLLYKSIFGFQKDIQYLSDILLNVCCAYAFFQVERKRPLTFSLLTTIHSSSSPFDRELGELHLDSLTTDSSESRDVSESKATDHQYVDLVSPCVSPFANEVRLLYSTHYSLLLL